MKTDLPCRDQSKSENLFEHPQHRPFKKGPALRRLPFPERFFAQETGSDPLFTESQYFYSVKFVAMPGLFYRT